MVKIMNHILDKLRHKYINNLYGLAMSQKLPVSGFKWLEYISEFNGSFIKSYNEESAGGYFLKVDVHYTENLHNLQNDLSFLPERMKLEKIEKLVANLRDKNE